LSDIENEIPFRDKLFFFLINPSLFIFFATCVIFFEIVAISGFRMMSTYMLGRPVSEWSVYMGERTPESTTYFFSTIIVGLLVGWLIGWILAKWQTRLFQSHQSRFSLLLCPPWFEGKIRISELEQSKILAPFLILNLLVLVDVLYLLIGANILKGSGVACIVAFVRTTKKPYSEIFEKARSLYLQGNP